MHSDAKSIKEKGDALFSKKLPYDTRNQSLADNFYVERADFTVTRDIGDEYADHLMTGYPALTRRDLGNSIGSMLRPKGQPWFHTGTDREENEDHEAKVWLEWATRTQRRAMYDRKAMFNRATKEADHDYAAFGGNVISCELNRRDNTLLYRCWHLRDMAWVEDSYGQLDEFHRNWKVSIGEMCMMFGDKVHQTIKDRKAKGSNEPCLVRHVVIRSENYSGDPKFKRYPWVSIYIDCENKHVIDERGSWTQIYNVARWATVSGSQYPYSPAAVIALPDARLLQAMTLTMLDAGERAANPPLIGVTEAIRGDVNVFPGGFTAIDAEYDERLGEVLRPLTQDKSGIGFGFELTDRTAGMIREAFYLNTLSLPPAGGPDMTAYEVGQRVQEYIRQALPLFEPIEDDYNASLCDLTFETLMRGGAFGPAESIPESIRGSEIQFSFESPLSQMIDRQKGQKFLEAKTIIADAMGVDETAGQIMDFDTTLRDVLGGIGAPAKWLRSPEDMQAKADADEEAMEAAAALEQMQKGADVASTIAGVSNELGGQALI